MKGFIRKKLAVDGKSFDVKQEQLRRLQEAFPESISEGQVDGEKLRLTLGEELVVKGVLKKICATGKGTYFVLSSKGLIAK